MQHVVIIGGGFGGLAAAKALARAPVRVTIIDRTNHHLFQPLLYQVATAGLSPGQIAAPIRSVFKRQKNVEVVLGEVAAIDMDAKVVRIAEPVEKRVIFDRLIIAVGACTSYFGHDDWAPYATGLKSLDEAVEIRRRVLVAFEQAERIEDPVERARLCTFVVIGGGPTGVELAGALIELSRHALRDEFRHIDPADATVILVEGGPRILSSFSEKLSACAQRQLEDLGVQVQLGEQVSAVDAAGVHLGARLIATETVMWAAGVRANPLVAQLGAPIDRGGRVAVETDCSLPGHPDVFVIGDAAAFKTDDGLLPGVSPVAMQQGRLVAANIMREMRGKPRAPFQYRDKGSMATIGRRRAIAQTRRMSLSGLPAWLAWLAVHLVYLVGHRNRLSVLFDWFWSFVTFNRGVRLITGGRMIAGAPAVPELPVQPALEANASPVESRASAR